MNALPNKLIQVASARHPAESHPPWHALENSEALARLRTDPRLGLTSTEAALRLQLHGPNDLPPPPKRPSWLRFFSQFHNVLIYVMVAASLITALLQRWVDTGVLLVAVIVNAVIGYLQEGKAEAALDAIRGMLSLKTIVIRDSEHIEIPARELVPGDIVAVSSGDKVPADLRLLFVKNLRVSESVLTGESVAVEKSPALVDEGLGVGDRINMLYSGTVVTFGQGVGLVVATGASTELGRISSMLERVESVTTPLLRQIARFSHWLAGFILVMAAATFVIGVAWRGHAPGEMFLMVVALAASAIPEGLPAIMTITLAMGVGRMATRRAIVRRLPAVETLGSVTVICSDKTGTLTRNEMAVQRVISADRIFEVSGAGYGPMGGIHLAGKSINAADHPELVEIGRAVALCNDAVLHHRNGDWQLQGDPTEGALLAFANKAGIDIESEAATLPRTDVIPFESEHRLMATLHHDHEGNAFIFLKGAPERVLDMCATQRSRADETALDPDYWRRQATDSAARGLRLLAVAMKRVDATQRELNFADIEQDVCLLALLGIIDPPREEAVVAVADCRTAGIRVKMITGDHVETARAVGAQLGIGREKPTLTGAEIEIMDDARLREVVPEVDVFARASPEHKLRLVKALQATGQIVAMTGDGVNDAPALKRADIGVAMGLKGTEAAKEAAHIVLADDNFATISNAVREGRATYENIRKFVLFMLPTNGGEALIVIAAIFFDLALPLTAAQVLWINMATSSTLGLALAFEPPEHDLMHRPPRDPRRSLLSHFFAWRVLLVSVLMMAAALGLFLWELERGTSVETARTMAVSTVVAIEIFYLISSRHILQTALSREGLLGNRHALVTIAICAILQLAFVYAPPMQKIFGSTALDPSDWAMILAAGAFVFAVAELEKFSIRRLGKFQIGLT